jgi:hypothetical protein
MNSKVIVMPLDEKKIYMHRGDSLSFLKKNSKIAELTLQFEK